MDIAIFGAQGHALGAYMAISELFPKRKVNVFLVSSLKGNPAEIDGIPVRKIEDYAKELKSDAKSSVEVIIATPENTQSDIEEILENSGFLYYRALDSAAWAELMKSFYIRKGNYQPLSIMPVGHNRPFVRVYMARYEKDKVLREECKLKDYMHYVQAGAKNAKNRVAELRDNIGVNISEKNGNYSELTVLYWIWKNKLNICGDDVDESRQYFGLAQYRRFLDLSDDDILRLQDNDIDVVLPYPMPYEPCIHAHHERYLKNDDWEAMKQSLSELQPKYVNKLEKILGQEYFYNYNVILAKKKVLREYCEWLFPVLARAEELSIPRGNERNDRYIG